MSSASKALVLFAVALVSPASTFGTVTLLMSIFWIFSSFNRGALGNPLLLVSNLPLPKIRVESGYDFSWAAFSGVIAGAAVFAVSLVTGDMSIGIAIAIAMPAVLVQDILRFGAIAQGQSRLAAQSDLFWLSCMAIVFGVNTAWQALPPVAVIYIWAASGLVSMAIVAVGTGTRPRARRIFEWWSRYAAARLRFGVATSLSMVSVAIATAVVTAILDPAAAGAFRGAASLFGPIAMLISAIPLVFIPSARVEARSARHQWRILIKTATVTSSLTVLITICMLLVPDEIGALLLGETWLPASHLILFVGLESAAMCWVWSGYTLFQTLGRTKVLIGLRTIQSLLQIGSVVTVAVLSHSVLWVAVALASATGLMFLVGTVVATVVAERADRHRDALVQELDASEQAESAGSDKAGFDNAPWPEIDVLAAEAKRGNGVRRSVTTS